MKIKLWGVRGSLPAPMDGQDYQNRINQILELALESLKKKPGLTVPELVGNLPPELSHLVGGDTTCVQVSSGDTTLVIDLGTGARRLGYDLAARKYSGDLHILMTHTHWDHIQGWPFFAPAYNPNVNITFHSGLADCEQRFTTQQQFSFFPVRFEDMPSKRSFQTFTPGESFQIGPFHISTSSLIHPGGSVAYRIEADGKVFIFATDTEFYGDGVEKKIQEFEPFFRDADLLIIDGQYSEEESALRVGWGHTSTRMGLRAAVAWKVKTLVVTHHEPAHIDKTIYDLFRKTAEFGEGELEGGKSVQFRLAVQGDEYEL